jgi:D-alanyl-D-alanine carboxypeptidase/D-alanyl-D-alanine-endopeptidase (penicillin-binding protein 4)
LSVVVQEVQALRPRLAWQAQRPVNPASVTKLLTTYAALDRLGPAWTWTTPVWLNGPVRDGVLEGSLHIQGRGDPKLVPEKLWALLRRVQQLGVREIRGDIVLDQSAFRLPEGQAGDFDGEPTRPYNVRPAALLLNLGVLSFSFTPDPATGLARVTQDPPLAHPAPVASVPLLLGPCGDWRSALKLEPGPPVRFTGGYPASCGELNWPLADLAPTTWPHRVLAAAWAGLGGQLTGSVRDGAAPVDRKPSFEWASPPLTEVVRDINKFSNNVMAQQLFLTLDAQAHPGQTATLDSARVTLWQWLVGRLGEPTLQGWVLDNGSGLSRDTRVTAQGLARLLQQAWDSPVMPELLASLPIAGLDGTLRRWAGAPAPATTPGRRTPTGGPGRAHLKTGTLRDVNALAGYVLSASGRRYLLVAVVQHPNAPAARPALDTLVQWVLQDAPNR